MQWGLIGQASAQTATPVPQAEADRQVFEEVIVTAQKRSENALKAPLAISVISADDIVKKNINTVDSLQYNTPGLTVSSRGYVKNINIRGIGLAVVSPSTSSGVINYRDGVLVTHEFALIDPYFDVDRIEVLRGPQGTVVGSNSTGGAIFVNSRSPRLDGTSGYITQGFGNYSDIRTEAAVNAPLTDTLAVRIAGYHDSIDSYWHSTTAPGASAGASNDPPGGLTQDAVRVGLLFKPTGSLTISLKSEYDKTRGGGIALQPTTFSAFYAYASHDRFGASYDYSNTLLRQTSSRTILQVDYDMGHFATLRSQSAYTYLLTAENDDLDGSTFPGSWQTFKQSNRVFQQEFDLISLGSGPFQWNLGAFTYADKLNNIMFHSYTQGRPTAPQAVPTDTSIGGMPNAYSSAVFGQASFQLTPTLKVTGGLRYTHDRRDSLVGGITINPLGLYIPNNGYYAQNAVTGKLGLDWSPDNINYFYAFAARGGKAGGFNTSGSPFGAERVWDYEAGWKGTPFSWLRTQLGGFYMNYQGFQLNVFDPLVNQSSVTNAANATIRGIEFSAQAHAGRFAADANAAYIKSSLGAAAIRDSRYPTAAAVELAGKALPFSPRFTGSIGAEYAFPVGARDLTVRAQLSYVGGQWAQAFQVPERDRIPDRTLLDLHATYVLSDAWRVEAYANNVLDKYYVQAIVSSATNDNRLFGDPRTFGARATYTFH